MPLASGSLKAQLRRAERMRKLRAFALVLPLLLFLIVTFVVPILDMLRLAVVDRDLATVWPHVASGTLKPAIDTIFPLDRAPDAHRLMESGDHVGKIVLEIG